MKNLSSKTLLFALVSTWGGLGCSGDSGTPLPGPSAVSAPGAVAEPAPAIDPVEEQQVIGSPEASPVAPVQPPAPAVGPEPIETVAKPPAVPACDAVAPLAQRVRPLSGVQYENTIRSIFPEVGEIANPHEFSDLSSKFSNGSHIKRFDFAGSQSVMQNASALSSQVAAGEIAATPCLANGAAGCVGDWVRSLGRKIYREPVDDAQATKLVALFDAAAGVADSEAAVSSVIRAMLTSPRFLFRRELGQLNAQTGRFELTTYELASALAYTLTDSTPDAELSAAVDSGMSAADLVSVHVPRLLASGEAGRRGMSSFVTELLSVGGFRSLEKNPELFPMFDEALQEELATDFRRTVDATLTSAEPTFRELMVGNRFVMGERSREFLGWQGNQAGGEAMVSPEAERMGLLTHPVFLGTYATDSETNPVSRGHFISAELLCVNVPSPPVAVEFPEPLNDGVARTRRQVLTEQHSAGACASCHMFMDPLGFPFEVFDAAGRLRSEDNGLPIDSSGSILGTNEIDGDVQNVTELVSKIADSNKGRECFAENAFKYVAGTLGDNRLSCRVERLSESFNQTGGDLPQLFADILSSPEFLERAKSTTL